MISQVAMAEEFQVCSGNWWNSPRNMFGSSPCSWAVNDFGNLGWPSKCDEPVMDVNDMVISCDDSAGSASDGSCTTLPDAPKTQPRILNGSLSTDCWNQDFLHDSGRSEENYSQIMNYRQENWINPKNFCEDLSSNPFKQVNQDFSIQHKPLNSSANSIKSCAATCEEIPITFPLNPSSYSYTSSLMQNLLGLENSQPHILSFLDDQEMDYLSEANYGMNPKESLLSSLPKSSSMVIQPSRQQLANNFPFSNNNTRFWNPTASALRNDSSNFIPSTNSPILPSLHNSITNNIPINISAANNREGARDVVSMAKKQNSSEPAFKRPRIETPSPLPTFKVRKEKLGDRITSLQQLVSPFGKTDTASVLHEAIEYIKFLHDQVKVLSTPYLKNGSPVVLQHQQAAGNNPKHREGLKQDLRGRGLCLVPISSTFPVAAETSSDFWTHTFGVSFRIQDRKVMKKKIKKRGDRPWKTANSGPYLCRIANDEL